jgi:hypothetical protein
MRKVRKTKTFGLAKRGRLLTKIEIAKLELHDGDVLVLRSSVHLNLEQTKEFLAIANEEFGKHFPNVKIIVLSGLVSLAVVADRRTKRAALASQQGETSWR